MVLQRFLRGSPRVFTIPVAAVLVLLAFVFERPRMKEFHENWTRIADGLGLEHLPDEMSGRIDGVEFSVYIGGWRLVSNEPM